jgi:hypothetical protein
MNDIKSWIFLKKNIEVSENSLYSKRVSICSKCDRLFSPTFQCKECGCFMKIKAKLENARCPLGKW